MKIDIENLSFKYDDRLIFENAVLKIENEIVALMGKSGSGKSTLIKIITSFFKPLTGEVNLNSQNIAYVSQSSHKTLFLWMTVEDNIYYPNKLRKTLNDETKKYCDNLLTIFKIDHLRKSFVLKLSEGEQKRLSLAVALSYKPEIVLLDEPFSGIDLILSKELWSILLNDFKNRNVTALFITHNTQEAAFADRVVFLNSFKKIQNVEKTVKDFNNTADYTTYILEQFETI